MSTFGTETRKPKGQTEGSTCPVGFGTPYIYDSGFGSRGILNRFLKPANLGFGCGIVFKPRKGCPEEKTHIHVYTVVLRLGALIEADLKGNQQTNPYILVWITNVRGQP